MSFYWSIYRHTWYLQVYNSIRLPVYLSLCNLNRKKNCFKINVNTILTIFEIFPRSSIKKYVTCDKMFVRFLFSSVQRLFVVLNTNYLQSRTHIIFTIRYGVYIWHQYIKTVTNITKYVRRKLFHILFG